MGEQSPYDAIAAMYDQHWRNWYLPAALPALEAWLFREAPAKSRVLDVCCGCGHVTGELVRRGYAVTGVDLSAELIEIARKNIAAHFLVGDVRCLGFAPAFDAALCTFDALNHLLSLEELAAAFQSVRGALRPGGLFVFDMNLDEAYTLDLHNWHCTVDAGHAFLVRGNYDRQLHLATTELIWFIRTDGSCWSRRASVVEERCYPMHQIVEALAGAGFHSIQTAPARDLGVSADLGFGRIYFSARA